MGYNGHSVSVDWTSGIQTIGGIAGGELFTPTEDHLDIGNFERVQLLVEAVGDVTNAPLLNLYQSLNAEGPWDPIWAPAVGLAARGVTFYEFTASTGGNTLMRFLRWGIADPAAVWQVHLRLSVLLRR